MLVLCILIFAGTHRPASEGTGEYRLPVFETSDIHGALADVTEDPYQYRVAYIADKVNDARMDDGGQDCDRTILLDGGDIYQGNAISLLSEGEAMSAVFDEMQYDAVAVGNHEFDWGIDTVIDNDCTMRDYTVDDKTCKNSIPVLCSNMYKDGKKVSFAKDYLILKKTAADASGETKKVRVAVIGFVEDYSYSVETGKFIDLGYTIDVDYDEVNRLASELEAKKKCDATILLAHGDPDAIAEGLGNSTCIDLVLGGHIHKNINGKTESGLTYLSPSGSAYAYTYDELVFENDGKGGVRIKQGADDKAHYYKTVNDGSLVAEEEEAEDELDRNVIDITNLYIDRVMPLLKEELGYITESVTKEYLEGSGNRVSTACNFVCDAMRQCADVDVAFINKSGVRGNYYIDEGDRRTVTVLDMYDMCPFDDHVYCYELTYAELLDVINFTMNGSGRGLLTSQCGIDCYYIDDPNDDGSGKYPWQMVDALVKDGTLIYKDGQWIDDWDSRKVKIGVLDYAAKAESNTNGDPNPLYGYNNTSRLYSTELLYRDCVIDGLKEEAESGNGHLYVDTQPHFIYHAYDEEH